MHGFPCDEDEPELELTFQSSSKKNRGEPSTRSTKANNANGTITPEFMASITMRLEVEKARQAEIAKFLSF